jgi:hypothetical protein
MTEKDRPRDKSYKKYKYEIKWYITIIKNR